MIIIKYSASTYNYKFQKVIYDYKLFFNLKLLPFDYNLFSISN